MGRQVLFQVNLDIQEVQGQVLHHLEVGHRHLHHHPEHSLVYPHLLPLQLVLQYQVQLVLTQAVGQHLVNHLVVQDQLGPVKWDLVANHQE